MHDQESENSLAQLAEGLAGQLDADVVLYNGRIVRPWDTVFIEECDRRQRRTNVLLILVTEGGDADPAYRIARCLQLNYTHISLYVSGYCKSAGTLLAAGAHELIMSDNGELGPLDVQMSKKDELWETQSGLIVMDTLTALQDNAFMAFEQFFIQLKAKSDDAITLKTATQIATETTTGLFAPLYGQVDPMHIGEARRAMSIASQYGQRLLLEGRNIALEELERITSEYPSHGFVIDRREASLLFNEVREPTSEESKLAQELDGIALYPSRGMPEEKPFKFLNEERKHDAEHGVPEGAEHVDSTEETTTQFETGHVEETAVAGLSIDRSDDGSKGD